MHLNKKICNLILLCCITLFATGCSHTMSISSYSIPINSDINEITSKKVVAYVMSEIDRNKQVTTPGGGGDSCSYFPYRDIERGYRKVLKSLYKNAIVVDSANDFNTFKSKDIYFIFTPEIYTNSKSESAFTWPPTEFSVDIISTVTDNNGNIIARIKVTGVGKAEYSEFKNDFGLSGSRAVEEALKKFEKEIKANPIIYPNK